MKLPLRLLDEAKAEMSEAAEWYRVHASERIRDRFIEQVEIVFERIRTTPEVYAIAERGARKALVKRFRYSVIYKVEDGEILVISVFHNSRDPESWQSRDF